MSSISKDHLNAIADGLFDTYKSQLEVYLDVLNTDASPDPDTMAELERRLKDECDLVECKECGLWIELIEMESYGQLVKTPEEHSCPKTVSLDSTCNMITETLQPENILSAPQS
jgi:hypothetical protein